MALEGALVAELTEFDQLELSRCRLLVPGWLLTVASGVTLLLQTVGAMNARRRTNVRYQGNATATCNSGRLR